MSIDVARKSTDIARGLIPSWLAEKSGESAGRFGLLMLTVIMFGGFALALPASFPTQSNAFNILGTQATLGILALAVMIPLIAGQFDLSVGNALGFSALFSVTLVGEHGLGVVETFLAASVLGIAIGAINAFFVVAIGLSAFIATLGTATVLGGLSLYISGGRPLFEGLTSEFIRVGQGDIGGLPLPFVYFLAITVVLWYMLEYTPLGRLLAAVGLGRSAARLVGIRVRGFVALAFIISGALSALAGVVYASQLGSASPSAGPDLLLPAFAAAFLGATTIKPGQFNAWGTFIGLYFLAIGIVGLQQLGLPFWFTPVFNGIALLVAVSATAILARRHERSDT